MKKTWIVLCSAIVLVGCDRNRGGMGNDSSSDTGVSSSRDTTYRNTPDASTVVTNQILTNQTVSPVIPANGKAPGDNPY
jgi:hypothetical protein